MAVDIRGEVALVTGASRGIGEAVALALAEAGCPVALLARSSEGLDRVARACRERGVEALPLVVDLAGGSSPAGLAEAVNDTVQALGGLSILVNNAGILTRALSGDIDMAALRRTFEVNVLAAISLTELCLPHIRSARRGAVINIASIAGKMSFPRGAAYSGSKHAMIGWTGSLFEDVREAGVKVCAICPGFVSTSMIDGRGLKPERMIQPADVAEAVLFVARFPATGCPTELVIRPQHSPYT